MESEFFSSSGLPLTLCEQLALDEVKHLRDYYKQIYCIMILDAMILTLLMQLEGYVLATNIKLMTVLGW